MPHRPPRAFLAFATCLLLALASALRAAEPPPEPVYPERANMTDAQFSAAHSRWLAAHSEWEANLTAQQYLEFRGRERNLPPDPEDAKRDRQYERSQRLPLPTDCYTWQAAAAESKLDAATIAALAKDKIAYGPSVKQSFEPYLGGPVFITSDSILNAFHVLFEDSFRELELRRAARFRPDFEKLLTSARQLAATGDILAPERAALALQHLERVLGPALVLNGTPLDFFAAANRADIQAQVDHLNAATATELPAWLAPADPASLLAIDYARCKPVGFYTAPARLAAYFRAMRWLQLVPFRANREPEFDAMVLLACASHDCGFIYRTNLMSSILGPSDDPSPLELDDALDTTYPRRRSGFDSRLPEVRQEAVRKLIANGYYRINTDLRAQRTLAQTYNQLTFRIVPQSALPDSVLFQQLLDHDQKPSGLAVAALLGSPFASRQLTPTLRQSVVDANASADTRPINRQNGPSLYDCYLSMLRALFLPPEPEAPAFLRSEAWTAKSTQTALAGWAQMRHTFTLQAKMSVHYLGLITVPPGFVEPAPVFYARMGELIAECDKVLCEAEVYLDSATDHADAYRDLCSYITSRWINAPPTPDEQLFEPRDHSVDELRRSRWAKGEFEVLAKAQGWSNEENPNLFRQYLRKLVVSLEAKAARLERGEESLPASESDLRERWQKLARIVARLESLAHKQLRGQPWTNDESHFLKSYGEQLAFIHGYYGNSWLSPRDDAPRWAEVSGLPEPGKFLAAGVGRPREFYVLYPWNGTEVLCVGSVMQYYEYETAERLTDDAWRALLDSPAAPPLPAWFQPYAPPPAAPRADRD